MQIFYYYSWRCLLPKGCFVSETAMNSVDMVHNCTQNQKLGCFRQIKSGRAKQRYQLKNENTTQNAIGVMMMMMMTATNATTTICNSRFRTVAKQFV